MRTTLAQGLVSIISSVFDQTCFNRLATPFNISVFFHQTMFDGVWSPNIYRLSRPLHLSLSCRFKRLHFARRRSRNQPCHSSMIITCVHNVPDWCISSCCLMSDKGKLHWKNVPHAEVTRLKQARLDGLDVLSDLTKSFNSVIGHGLRNEQSNQ